MGSTHYDPLDSYSERVVKSTCIIQGDHQLQPGEVDLDSIQNQKMDFCSRLLQHYSISIHKLVHAVWSYNDIIYNEQILNLPEITLMPSPSASSKFVLSVLKFLGILKFLSYTQNILGVLK